MFTALSNILATHIILTHGDIIWSGLFLLMAASAALFSGGMALNDWFDYKIDCQERPNRPLPSGKIQRRHALLFACMLLVSGALLAAFAGYQAFYIALLIILFVVLYDGLLKRTLAGVLAMGGCRYLNWLLGLSLLPLAGLSLLMPVPILLYIMALTLLSREEESAQNNKIALLTAVGVIIAALSIIAIAVITDIILSWELALLFLGTSYIIYHLWQTYQNFSLARIQSTMQLLLFAIIPLDALMVAIFAPSWWALLILALLLPGKILARFMYVT